MKRNILSRGLSLFLCLTMVLPWLYFELPASAATDTGGISTYLADFGFEGKTISILGDSISTFENYSSGTAATTTNSTITNNAVYYRPSNVSSFGVNVNDTWWKQTADVLGMRVLVNNSWSGSRVLYTDSSSGYLTRSQQLHDNTGSNAGETPDVIAIFLGTNDLKNADDPGEVSAINYNTIQSASSSYTPASVLEAYALMLYRAIKRYPDAEIYCMTLIPYENISAAQTRTMLKFNAGVRTIAEHYGVYVCDLYNDSGLTAQKENFNYHMANRLHPGPYGMDAITNCLVAAMLENSKYNTSGKTLHSVSYDLKNVYVKQGTIQQAVDGKSLTLPLGWKKSFDVDATVTMGGKDITADCYSNGVISIPAVTGDVIVTARTVLKYNTPVSYRWETISNALQSVNDGGAIYNHATLIGGSCSGGVFTDGQHSLDNAVALFHDRPWVIEWKATGAWSSGALILAGAAESKVEGSTYIYKTTGSNLLAIGYSDGSKYHNYGLNLADYNIDGTATHIYRLVNEISEDGSNMVYLHVDGNKIGAMNNYYDGGTNMNTVSDKLNGMDLVFTNIGTSGHPLNNATISYIQVWEGGIPVETTLNDYRWEPANGTMTSVTVNGNIDNPAKLQSGSVGSDGKLSSSYFELDQAVKLLHDKPWSIQWKSTGTWKDSTNGAMLFAASNVTNAPFGAYIYRRGGSDLIAFGERNGSSHNNYGISLADHGIDGSAEHVYRLTNRINADGSNMVYLYVDGVELGAMNNYYVGSNAQGTTSNWISGKDFTFNYMGNAQFPISNCYLSYVQVWEDGLIPNDYRWEMSNDMLTSVTNDSFVQNDLTMVSGSISGGKLSGTQMKLEENLILRHDRNWSLEWKSSGSWKEASNGALLLSSNPTSTSDGTVYLYRRNDSNFIALGVRSNNKHLNYGVMLSDHGIDGSAEHVYRLTNRVNADGSNMVYLYVDDVELGAMNNYYIGGTAQGTTSDWVSGQDFVISYMGTTDFPIGNCCIDYIQVREMDTSFHEYRWETDTDRLNSISVGYTENNVTVMTGSITGGTYTDSMFRLEKTVVLRHNQPWFMEWQSEGSWNNSRGGALLLSSEDAANIAGNKYLFRRKDSTLIALGTNNGSKYENYGVRLSDYGIDASEAHVYRMENRVYANGSNMVYLYVDGVEISAMNHYFLGDAPQGTTSDWLSGKDFSFNYMGSTDYLIGNCTIGYIHIDEDGCMDNFRWENRSDVFTDVTIGGNSENEATMLSGSITNGLFSGTSFSLAQPVTLMHNQPWTLEWKSSGNWKDTQKGAMLLSSTAMHTTEGMSYLYRRSDSDFIAFGMLTNGAHMNYGIRLSDYGIDGTAVHTYLLSN